MDPPSLKGRIPLTTVSNNHSLQQQPPPVGIPSGNSFGINVPRKPDPILCDDKFFLYRKRQEKDQDPFGRLSDEVLLHIFKWLPKKALFRCGEVCRRFNRVTKDDSLWVRIDLSGRTLNSNALRFILNHGFTILRMAQTEIVWPSELVFHPDHRTKLQYLDLSMTTIDKRALFTLLAVCRNLRKLSLENIPLDDAICYEIAQNPNIETLNLSMCSDISPTGLVAIVSSLKKLHNLNVAWTHLSSSALTHLVTKCNPGMLRLNIAGCRTTMTDSEIASIVRRCPTLLELDVSDCTNLTQKSIDHLCRLQKLEYLALSRCYNINTTAYLKLANLETLAFLDIFGLMSDSSLAVVQSAMGCIGINKFYHSSIARPTIGSRRTSIWGIKTRD